MWNKYEIRNLINQKQIRNQKTEILNIISYFEFHTSDLFSISIISNFVFLFVIHNS